ncbi:MAG TPA: preprotein translocase subunit SecG [Deltaproteobacteria bacterium]|nr:preprotein translocase subunit SecG [Deltaproteobacteria bacterium]HOM27949.1 preprotein translocase subunit SecG [Deltaproteobacteria bacterium]HPP80785.1 preprotein translocase subunit SecG [Deltaproteobacteria bacterium]
MLYNFILVIHIIVCIGLVIAVLIQAGKGAEIGAVFGGAGSQALFGTAGPVDFIKKATLVMVVVFMLTSLTLGFFNLERPSTSVMSKAPAATQQAPSGRAGTSAPAAGAPTGVPATPSPVGTPAQAPAGGK